MTIGLGTGGESIAAPTGLVAADQGGLSPGAGYTLPRAATGRLIRVVPRRATQR